MATRGHAAHRGLLWMLCLFFRLPSVDGQCARFEFPGSKTTQDCDDCDTKLTVQNSHDVVLPFTLRTDNCSSSKQFFSITVTRKNYSKSTPSHVCKLRVVNGTCITARQDVCPCGRGKGRYSLRMNLGDRDTLTWRTNDIRVASKTTVRIRLEGRPRFLEPGVIFDQALQQPLVVSFQVQTQTRTFTGCQLRKLPAKASKNPKELEAVFYTPNCTSDATISGSPPTVTLTLPLGNMTPDHVGTWQLRIENGFGSESITFEIVAGSRDSSAASTKTVKRVVSSDLLLPDDVTLIDGNTSGKGQGETDEKRNDDQDDSSVRIIVIVVIGVVVVVLVAVLVLIVVKLRRVKSSETDGQLRSAGRTYFREVQSSVLREDMTASVYGETKGDSHYPHFADSPPPTVDVDDLPPPWTTARKSSTEDGSGTLPPDQLQPLGGLLHRFDF